MSTHWPLSSLMHRVGDTSGIESGIELKRGKLYDRQSTGRAPLEVFSVVLRHYLLPHLSVEEEI